MLGTGPSFAVFCRMLKILVADSNNQVRAWKRSVLSTQRSTFHLSRKIYHSLMGLSCVALYTWVLNRQQALILLSIFGGLFLVLDFTRLKLPRLNALTLKLFGKIMRREELKSISGNSFYILGLVVLVLFFPKPIVILSTLFLALGDPIAAIVGSAYGKIKISSKGKTLEGACANAICSALVSLLFGVWYLELSGLSALTFGLLGAAISTFVELIPSPVDDNFTIPVGSAILLSVLAQVFHYSFV